MSVILNQQWNIGWGLYFSLIPGQITVYGVLLAYLQFVTSYSGNKDVISTYLGMDLMEYYLRKSLFINRRIVSSPIFFTLMILEVLYKPVITVFEGRIDPKMVNLLNFFWYLFVVCYFAFFIILLFQTSRSLLFMKNAMDVKRNRELIYEINQKIVNKAFESNKNISQIRELEERMLFLKAGIRQDGRKDLYPEYGLLVCDLCEKYSKARKDAHFTNTYVTIEAGLFEKIIKGYFLEINENLAQTLCNIYIHLVQQNIGNAAKEKYEQMDFTPYSYMAGDSERRQCRMGNSLDLVMIFYTKVSDEYRRKFMNNLLLQIKSDDSMFRKFAQKCLQRILEQEILAVFRESRKQEDFINIFQDILRDEEENRYCALRIAEEADSYQRIDISPIIKLLKPANCAFLLSYFTIYYSVYQFRGEWEYINVPVLKTIWENIDELGKYHEEADHMIQKSRISHRYRKTMLTEFIQDMKHTLLDDEFLKQISNKKQLDAFYIAVIKMCAADQKYYGFMNPGDPEIKIEFINRLAKHEELTAYENIKMAQIHMYHDYFSLLSEIPEQLEISLKTLLLAHINTDAVINGCKTDKGKYLYYKSLGKYLLIHIDQLTEEQKQDAEIRKTIEDTFASMNMSGEKYIKELQKECQKCGENINYVQQQAMLKYLIEGSDPCPGSRITP